MPLTHINGPDPDHHVAAPERTLRPAAVVEAERETVKKAVEHVTSPAIERARKRIATLREANASPALIEQAEGKLRDAILDYHEGQAEKRNKVREAAHRPRRSTRNDTPGVVMGVADTATRQSYLVRASELLREVGACALGVASGRADSTIEEAVSHRRFASIAQVCLDVGNRQ